MKSLWNFEVFTLEKNDRFAPQLFDVVWRRGNIILLLHKSNSCRLKSLYILGTLLESGDFLHINFELIVL